MLAFVLLALLAVCHGQFAKLVFPPAVEFINSDFDMIASGEKAGTGLFLSSLSIPTVNRSFRLHQTRVVPLVFQCAWRNLRRRMVSPVHFQSNKSRIIGDGKGNDEIYVVQNTVCTRGSSPIPPVQCSGWEEDASGVWTQNCVVDNNGGNVDFTCKLANNGQPIWVRRPTK
jgi:hypothetical protein